MAIKILMLKSGEDIICDVANMGVEVEGKEKVIGYYMTKPCTFEGEPAGEPNCYNIKLKAWTPLAKDTIVPITAEWVITILDPIDDLARIYHKQVLAPQSVAEWRGEIDNIPRTGIAKDTRENEEETDGPKLIKFEDAGKKKTEETEFGTR